MTRRYAHLIAVAMLVAVTTVPIFAQQETVAELRAKAEQGDAAAQHGLWYMHENGRGVPQDDTAPAFPTFSTMGCY